MSEDILRIVYREAVELLREKAGADLVADIVKRRPGPNTLQLLELRPKKLDGIYRNLIESLLITRPMRETIGEPEAMAEALHQFDPLVVHKQYGEDWEGFLKVCSASARPGHKKNEGSQINWEIFCGAALSGASFLEDLGSVWMFENFVAGFAYPEMTTAVLPLLLQHEICGLTFASACHFLRKCGHPEFVQIDNAVKALLYELGLTTSKQNYHSLKTLLTMARANRVEIEEVNTVLFMIGSGRVEGNGQRDSNMTKAFCDRMRPIVKAPASAA